jgi:hypothetical protein
VIKAIVLVPERDNDGRRFSGAHWRELELRLAQLGGFSLLPGRVTGGWMHQGRLYRDLSRQYLVVLSSWFELAPWLEVVVWARAAFRQQALYIDVAGVPEIVHG